MSSESTRTRIVRSRRGRFTIPAAFRNQLGIDERTPLRLTLEDDALRITPVRAADASHGSPWLRELYELFAPVREEIRARGIPEAEVNSVPLSSAQ